MSDAEYCYPNDVIFRSHDPRYSPLDDAVYYPVNHAAVQTLVGRVMTTLDAMGLPDRAHRAARSLLMGDIWRWWNDQYENTATSVDGCLAPITAVRPDGAMPAQYSGDPRELTNRWGYTTQAEWVASLPDRTADSLPIPIAKT